MKIKHVKYFLLLAAVVLFVFNSCKQKENKQEPPTKSTNSNFEIEGFNALTNYGNKSDSIRPIEFEFYNAINTGFILPAKHQTESGNFICTFRVKNNSGKSARLAYKIYYQDESYKFPEVDSTGKKNEYATENFYGSWEDTLVTFNRTYEIPADGQFHECVDSIRIIGNPRNEDRYIDNGKNKRWKRNPRVGIYSFFLVVTAEENLNSGKIPDWITHINHPNGKTFESPYYYFNFGDGLKLNNTICEYSSSSLKVIAHPDLGSGVYYDGYYFKGLEGRKVSKNNCANDTAAYMGAPVSQFVHYIDASMRFENIPVIGDVLKDNYSKRDYNWNRAFYRKEELISNTPMTASLPCETIFSDPVNKKIVIHNPKTTPGNWRKENVGIITRNGLCYGKFRVKAKLTELLNKNNMWNGITNAIWMINQGGDNTDWNFRRPCRKAGYMATYWGGENDNRVERVGYSEIDFEILKTSPYCPDQTFPPIFTNPTNNPHDISSWNTLQPAEILKDDANIIVACTNWDMACWEPENFGVGCNTISYGDKQFYTHRWNNNYRALTEKSPQPDDALFAGPYYYFEIDWRPTEIIWRIGPEPDKMFVVGYMNEKVTSIPNNQMLLIITQEFHNTKWWPGSPYQQKNIPFPLNDIFGEILDITVE